MKKDNFCFSAAPRIVEERDRLGFTQEQIAIACGVSRVMWGKYERGLAAMGGEYLFSFAAQGADINYILTGKRSVTADTSPALQAAQDGVGYGYKVLSNDEQALIENYRACSAEGKSAIKTTSASLAQSAKILKKGKAA